MSLSDQWKPRPPSKKKEKVAIKKLTPEEKALIEFDRVTVFLWRMGDHLS